MIVEILMWSLTKAIPFFFFFFWKKDFLLNSTWKSHYNDSLKKNLINTIRTILYPFNNIVAATGLEYLSVFIALYLKDYSLSFVFQHLSIFILL